MSDNSIVGTGIWPAPLKHRHRMQPSPPPASASAVLDQIVAALRRGDRERADAAFAEARAAGDVPSNEALSRLAELNARRRRWADATWFFDRVATDSPTPAASFARNLSRNMLALTRHRPDVARRLEPHTGADGVNVGSSSTGHPTVLVRQPDGSTACLSPDNRPLAASECTLQQLAPTLAAGSAICLGGVGDGYLLYRLAHEPSRLILGIQTPVFVVEPDPRIAACAMMIHDFTGPEGPIEQDRFFWFVGQHWSDDLRAAVYIQPYMGLPVTTVGPGGGSTQVLATLNALHAELAADDNETKARVASLYADRSPRRFADLLAPGAGRKPRVLLLTTRFSTVLQYSTRDAAAAFEQLGWETRISIEPSAAHRLYQHGTRRILEQFEPDLVFQIDHLRHEHGDLFPKNLPFVCWAQDHLPNLIGDAGRRVGPNEFVLTDAVTTYAQDYGYPPGQCIGLSKLSRDVEAGDGTNRLDRVEEVVFVSNASRPPAALLDARRAELNENLAYLFVTLQVAEELLAAFADGDGLSTYPLIRRRVETVAEELGHAFTRDDVRRVAAWLYHPFCDAIYRQQALEWAADACTALGLSLGLYGKGWEHHPRLKPFARGPIENGPDLRELTRRATVNLQIVPYSCLHQRLLDGLAADGFFLVRQHLSDVAPRAMLDLLTAHHAGDAPTTAAAREAMRAASRPSQVRFENLLRACQDSLCSSGIEDPIECMQSLREIGFLAAGEGILPRLDDVSFSNAAELLERLIRFTADASERRKVAGIQKQSVQARFTYRAGIGRVVATIAERLADPVVRIEPERRTGVLAA